MPGPAQVEGGWVFGMGMMLQERVDYSAEGAPLYASTWDYKIPSAACIPREFNIALLKARTHGSWHPAF
jgi:CO/xanthine dehydrogenase Mo-binding subunit